MKKVVIISLSCIILALISILIYNIINLQKLENYNEEITKKLDIYNKNIEEINSSNVELKTKYTKLSTDNDTKMQEYEKWNRWTQEIEEKIS